MRWVVVGVLVAVIVGAASSFFLVGLDSDAPRRTGDDPSAASPHPSGAAVSEGDSGTGRGVAGGSQDSSDRAPRDGAGGHGSAGADPDGWVGAGGLRNRPTPGAGASPGAADLDGAGAAGVAAGGPERDGRGGLGRGGQLGGGGAGGTGGTGAGAAPEAGSVTGQSVVLRVVGAGGDGDLAGVTVLSFPPHHRNRIHPGRWTAAERVSEAADSPLTLPAASGLRTVWASAPGHCWNSVQVDHQEGGERLLALAPDPGVLVVQLENLYPESGAFLRVYRDRVRGDGVELTATEALTTLGGLAPGAYFVRVEIGGELWNSVLLGSADVTLHANLQETVTIQLADPPDLSGQVPLIGELTVLGNWDLASVAVIVQPLDVPQIQGQSSVTVEAAAMSAVGGILYWNAGLVVPGRYRVTVRPWGLCRTVTVASAEDPPVSIAIPEPGDVQVTVIEEGTGAPVEDLQRVSWWYRGMGELRGCQPVTELRIGAGNPAFDFPAPVGEIELSQLFDGTWRVDRTVVAVQPGMNQVVVEASRALGVRLRLFDGDTPLPVADLPVGIGLQGTAPGLSVVSWSNEADARVARLSSPGTYVLTVPTILGFAPIPPQNLDVTPAGYVDVDIDLVRVQ